MVASVNTQAQEVGEGNWYLGQVRKDAGNGTKFRKMLSTYLKVSSPTSGSGSAIK